MDMVHSRWVPTPAGVARLHSLILDLAKWKPEDSHAYVEERAFQISEESNASLDVYKLPKGCGDWYPPSSGRLMLELNRKVGR